MTTNSGRPESDGEVPRWAATAGRGRWAHRQAARLFCSPRRTTDDRGPDVTTSGVPSVRQEVLREYQVGNLAQARRASEEMVPYGYRAQRVRVAPAGRRPRWRTRLVIEFVEATTVKMIFTWRGEDDLTITAIRQRLVAARCPAPLDPETGQPGVWTRAAIRAILRNPKYTGRQVWGRRRHGRRAPRTQWVWSPVWAHTPLITSKEFAAAKRRSWRVEAPPSDNNAAPPSEQGRAA
jgi:hypothetical protein